MTGARLRQAADDFAAELNLLDPESVYEWLAEVAAESPYWDDRTNLFCLAADRLQAAALVLATHPGGDDYLIVRWAGEWFVDADLADWEAILEAVSSAELDEHAGGLCGG
jgi:hypothetical protein